MKKQLTILQVLPALESGGVERGTVDIARAIKDAGHVSLVASNGGQLVDQLDVMHFQYGLHRKSLTGYFDNVKWLVQLIKEHNIDIVHVRSRAPAWAVYKACKITDAKMIATFHGSYGMQNCLKRFYNSVMLKGECVIAVSNFIKDYIQKYYDIEDDLINVIHRGVDMEFFRPLKNQNIREELNISNDDKIILLPARFTDWKGHRDLITALLKLDMRDIHTVFIGNGIDAENYISSLKTQASSLKTSFITKAVQDMRPFYVAADIVVSSSTRPEAFGRVPNEAQAMGKTVVASNHGGAAETIEHGISGYHYEANNVGSLVEVLKHAIENPLDQKIVREMAGDFSLKKMQEKTLQLYYDIC